MDHSLQLKYQRNYSIIINDCDVSLFYYFDYGERYKQINMEFQHSLPGTRVIVLQTV